MQHIVRALDQPQLLHDEWNTHKQRVCDSTGDGIHFLVSSASRCKRESTSISLMSTVALFSKPSSRNVSKSGSCVALESQQLRLAGHIWATPSLNHINYKILFYCSGNTYVVTWQLLCKHDLDYQVMTPTPQAMHTENYFVRPTSPTWSLPHPSQQL